MIFDENADVCVVSVTYAYVLCLTVVELSILT